MIIKTISIKAVNFHEEGRLQRRFLNKLQEIIDSGGKVISITRDDKRHKKAYVMMEDEYGDKQ